MGTRVNYNGLVIAGVGFFLTRFTVSLALYEAPIRFYLAGIVPLALGLGLATFGVALTVADVRTELVRTTALWCVVGTGVMFVLVVLTLLGSAGGIPDFATVRSRTYLSNFLIGGSVGGTLTGLYASRTRRQRDALQQQRNRLEVLNRILRHEVLNSLSVIRGYGTIPSDGMPDARSVIQDHSDSIERTIEEVKYLAQSVDSSEVSGMDVDLIDCLTDSVTQVRDTHPDATITVESHPETVSVNANNRLGHVFTHLLENAIVYSTEAELAVDVAVTTTVNTVRVSITDYGPGLPESQQSLLETGAIQEFDDPDSGFGLNIVRLLVESYNGEIETDTGPDGTTVTVVLLRTGTEGTGLRSVSSGVLGVRPALPQLLVTFVAALIAAVPYGIAAEQLGGSVAAIGVFYGIQDPLVGWITHEFHSVVFAFVFAGLVSLAPRRYHDHLPAYVAIGSGWAVFLWVVAAGVVAPVWLQLLGVPASVPTFSEVLLVSHLLWGISLGALTAWGYDHVAPRLARLSRRLPHGLGGP